MTCTKKSFETPESAAAALKLIARDSSRQDIPTRYYSCPDCGKYHHTKRTKEKKRSAKQKFKGKTKREKLKPHQIIIEEK
jgi:hypothetical protein